MDHLPTILTLTYVVTVPSNSQKILFGAHCSLKKLLAKSLRSISICVSVVKCMRGSSIFRPLCRG